MTVLFRIRVLFFWLFLALVLASGWAHAQDGIINPQTDASKLTTGQLPPARLQLDSGALYNCSLAASVASNALTVALKTQAGADPTAASPCVISFTSANGVYTPVQVTAATSFSTGTSGSTFGSSSGNAPFKLWVTALNNAGTVVLGVSNQSSTTTVLPLSETVLQSSTACNACTNATTLGTIYTTAAQTNLSVRILGFMEWGGGLATAGLWASAPSNVRMMTPGGKKPGDTVQTKYGTNAGATAYNGTTNVQTGLTVSITPTSSANLISVDARGSTILTTGCTASAQISRGNGPTLIGAPQPVSVGATATFTQSPFALDAPQTLSATSYFVYVFASGATGGCTPTWNNGAVTTTIIATEIMG